MSFKGRLDRLARRLPERGRDWVLVMPRLVLPGRPAIPYWVDPKKPRLVIPDHDDRWDRSSEGEEAPSCD
jgi:hypothetical protein